MIQSYCEGRVPAPAALAAEDDALLGAARGLLEKVRAEYAEQSFHRALELEWHVVAEANRYVDLTAPWSLRRSDQKRMATVLYVLAETIRHLAVLAQPVVPAAASRLLDQLAQPHERRTFASLAHPLEPGTALPRPEGIFPRYVEDADSRA